MYERYYAREMSYWSDAVVREWVILKHLANFMGDLLFRCVVGLYYFGLKNRQAWIGMRKCSPEIHDALIAPLARRYGLRSYHFANGWGGDVTIGIPVELIGGSTWFWRCAPNKDLALTPLDLNIVWAHMEDVNTQSTHSLTFNGPAPEVVAELETLKK